MRDLHLPTQQSPPILLERHRRNAVMALEPGQGRKTAALRDAHQVPLLTGGALYCLGCLDPSVQTRVFMNLETQNRSGIRESFREHCASHRFQPRARLEANGRIGP